MYIYVCVYVYAHMYIYIYGIALANVACSTEGCHPKRISDDNTYDKTRCDGLGPTCIFIGL